MPFQRLLSGLDTVQCAYFYSAGAAHGIDFGSLLLERETLREAKTREPKPIEIDGESFLLQPYGSSSGYPLVLTNRRFKIECGEFNNPSFFITFRSEALWHEGAKQLHGWIIQWANSIGLVAVQTESLSRVDFSFDYYLPVIDFDENSFISRSTKDSQFRSHGQTQTFSFGKGDVVLRVYDKVAEINEQSHKHWFYDLWGKTEDVWRIEWQIRKSLLNRFGIRTFDDLMTQQGDLLRYLVTEHDTLRKPNEDNNRSRWPLHPLWQDLESQINQFNSLGIYRELDNLALLAEKNTRMTISMYGYLKSIAANQCVRNKLPMISIEDTVKGFYKKIIRLHHPLSWKIDVQKKINQIRLGQ